MTPVDKHSPKSSGDWSVRNSASTSAIGSNSAIARRSKPVLAICDAPMCRS